MKVRSITLYYSPLRHVTSPGGVIRCISLLPIVIRRCSNYASLAAYIPPQSRWWQLKSPRRTVSIRASLIIVFIVRYVLIRGPLSRRLQTLIIQSSLPLFCRRSAATSHKQSQYDQLLMLISLLTIKQTFIVRFTLVTKTQPLGQYVVLVLLLKPGSQIVRIQCFTTIAILRISFIAPQFTSL